MFFDFYQKSKHNNQILILSDLDDGDPGLEPGLELVDDLSHKL